jgi:hypothetical protein
LYAQYDEYTKVCDMKAITTERERGLASTQTRSPKIASTRGPVVSSSSSSKQTLYTTNPAKMSDFEDDMEIDAPVARDTVMFNSDNTNSKGKRSAANLPVEAEDSLPW